MDSYEVEIKDSGKIWVPARNIPFWLSGNCSFLSDEEIKTHLGDEFLEKHQEKYRHAIKDRDEHWVFPGDFVREYVNYPDYPTINKDNPKTYWTKKGWSDLSIYDQYIIYKVDKIRLGLAHLSCVCLKTDMWEGKKIKTETVPIQTNPSQAVTRGAFERGWQLIGLCDETLVKRYLEKERPIDGKHTRVDFAKPKKAFGEIDMAMVDNGNDNVAPPFTAEDIPVAKEVFSPNMCGKTPAAGAISDLDNLIEKFEKKEEKKSPFKLKLRHIPYKLCPICDAAPRELQVHFTNPSISAFYTAEMEQDQSEHAYFACGCAYRHSYVLPNSGTAASEKCPNAHERLLTSRRATPKLGSLEYQFEHLTVTECPVCNSKVTSLKVEFNLIHQGSFYTGESVSFVCGCRYRYEKGKVVHLEAVTKCPNAHDEYLKMKERVAGYGYHPAKANWGCE
jgi:hypothetical protein